MTVGTAVPWVNITSIPENRSDFKSLGNASAKNLNAVFDVSFALMLAVYALSFSI